jgi:hypothetical protein
MIFEWHVRFVATSEVLTFDSVAAQLFCCSGGPSLWGFELSSQHSPNNYLSRSSRGTASLIATAVFRHSLFSPHLRSCSHFPLMEVIKRPSLRSRAESFLHISAPSTKGLIYCPSTPLLKGRIGSLKTTPGHIKAKLSLPNLLTSGISWGPSVAPSSPCKNYLREASQADEAPRITPRTNIKRIRDGIPYPVSHNSIMNEV